MNASIGESVMSAMRELGFMGEALNQIRHSGELDVIHQKSIKQVEAAYAPGISQVSTLFLLPDNTVVNDLETLCEVEVIIRNHQTKEPEWVDAPHWRGYELGSIRARWKDYHTLNRSRYRASFNKDAGEVTLRELEALTTLIQSDSGLLAMKKIQLWIREGEMNSETYLGPLPNTEPVKRFIKRLYPLDKFMTTERMTAIQHQEAARLKWCSLAVNTAFWYMGNQR